VSAPIFHTDLFHLYTLLHQADVLVEYLRDFAQAQERAGRIKYSTAVLKISRPADQGRTGFVLTTAPTGDAAAAPTDERCKVLIVATGLSKANPATNIRGIEHAIGYEDLPPTGESFAGKSVAIFGFGNGAMETADVLGEWVNFVHVWPGRTPRQKPKEANAPGVPDHFERAVADPHDFVSWESRYVGNR
jgi:thioredoxin reductase